LKRSGRIAAVAIFATMFVWGGCALVIDLGPEAQLRPDASSPETGAGPSVPLEAGLGGGDAAVAFVCGLEAAPNAACASCIQAQCCDESKVCATDPVCVQGLECIKDCMAQIVCIIGCLGTNPALSKVTTCSSRQCPVCTPGPDCTKLGACCRATYGDGGSGEGKVLLDVCRGDVLGVDEQECQNRLDGIIASPGAAPQCTGQSPPPNDASADAAESD
jgi:hypothetical protein